MHLTVWVPALMFILAEARDFTVKNKISEHHPAVEVSMAYEAQHAIKRGLDYLKSTQLEDGSWSHYPAITALAVSAFLRSPYRDSLDYAATIQGGIDFILKHVRDDGSIYAKDMPCYNTAICMMALIDTKDPKYAEIIRKARDYLISLQADEEEGYTAENKFYGGIGYGDDDRPDLSNLEWALEALRNSEKYRSKSEATGQPVEFSGQSAYQTHSGNVVNKELFWEKAIIFLQRCQNLKKYNDAVPESQDDGGFVYEPGFSQAGGLRSYGSMTYAGLKSFIYARVDKNDPRVQGAWKWINGHFTLEENPPIGYQGLFYYYLTMAKALRVYGADSVRDASGKYHNWRNELIAKLVNLQDEDGSWINQEARWWEKNRDLVTSYVVLTLEECLRR